MNDKVLTDDEKNALLDGMESGEVEVHSSSGPQYASVLPFQIPPRAHIVRGSYPRLRQINQQVAERLQNDAEQLLQCELAITAASLYAKNFSDVCEQLTGPSVVILFEAKPLAGSAAIVLEPAMVRTLVSAFFGGADFAGDVPEDKAFTSGEISVSNLFATLILSAVRESFAPMKDISPDRGATEVSLELVDIADEADRVIVSEFELALADHATIFRVIWPTSLLQPLLPALEGQKRERDAAEDARWEKAIRRRVADSVVSLTSNVGHACLSLGELTALTPGDVIEIDNPQQATVMAKNVRLLHGRLGVHRGRNAIETTEWIDASI